MLRKNKGITLIALVVTIIVLLILAAVSINSIIGENGIVSKAKKAQEETKRAKLEESLQLKLAEAQIDTLTGDSNSIEKIFGEMIVGLYKLEIKYNVQKQLVEEEIKGVFEEDGTIFEADFVIELTSSSDSSPTMNIENIVIVDSVNEMAEAMYDVMFGGQTKTEIVDETETVVGVKYKEKTYNIYYVGENGYTIALYYIELRENFDLSTKEWKNVFCEDDYVIAQDTNGKLWGWPSSDIYDYKNVTPIEFNTIIPGMVGVNVYDAIYAYDAGGDKEIIGFIDTNGEIYFIDYSNAALISMTDMFPDYFKGIKAEKVIPVAFNGINKEISTNLEKSIKFEFLSNVKIEKVEQTIEASIPFIILDKNGKVWSTLYDYNNEVITTYCVNNLSELSNVSFKEIVVSGTYNSEMNYIETIALASWFTILGLDSNGNLWKMQYGDYNYETGESYSDYRYMVKNVTSENNLPEIKDIEPVADDECATFIDENNILYSIKFIYVDDIFEVYSDTMQIKQYNEGWILDTDGNLYNGNTVLNSNFGDAKISEIYDYRYLLDTNGELWNKHGGNIEKVNGIKKCSTAEKIFSAIDSNNQLILSIIID